MNTYGSRPAKLVITNIHTKASITIQGLLDDVTAAAAAYLDRQETFGRERIRPEVLGNAWYDRAVRGRSWASPYRGTRTNHLMNHIVRFINV